MVVTGSHQIEKDFKLLGFLEFGLNHFVPILIIFVLASELSIMADRFFNSDEKISHLNHSSGVPKSIQTSEKSTDDGYDGVADEKISQIGAKIPVPLPPSFRKYVPSSPTDRNMSPSSKFIQV